MTDAPGVTVPWASWYEDSQHALLFPAGWQVEMLAPRGRPADAAETVAAALRNPLDAPPLVELAVARRTACIVVDDLARPTRAADILPMLVQELVAGGIPASRITVLVATGTHGVLSDQALDWKIGADIRAACQVEVHRADGDLQPTGIPYGASELRLNRSFMEADLKLGLGSVLPHSFAGFSGGAKLMLPGLADVPATSRSHKFVQMGLRGGHDPSKNKFRLEIEELARQLDFHWCVSVVTGPARETLAVVAGDIATAHRRACEFAAEAYATPLRETYDLLVLNAYPKDTELVQAENAFLPLKFARRPVVRDGGVLVLATAASEGLGVHGLFAPGGTSYREPKARRGLGNRELWIYAPSLSEDEVRALYWNGYPWFRSAEALRDRMAERASAGKAAVLPCAPMQILTDERE